VDLRRAAGENKAENPQPLPPPLAVPFHCDERSMLLGDSHTPPHLHHKHAIHNSQPLLPLEDMYSLFFVVDHQRQARKDRQ
jgi:hypothetical protein